MDASVLISDVNDQMCRMTGYSRRRRLQVSFNASVFRNPAGEVRGIFASARDITHSGRRTEGTGLGLHLCNKLAGLIQARIEFQSEFGKGSRFTVLLPEVNAADPFWRQAHV